MIVEYKHPTFNDIVWAIAIRKIIGYNNNYDELMKEKEFLKVLRERPYELNEDEINKHLLNFLNKWGCRITKEDFDVVSKEIIGFLKDNGELFNSLSGEKIQDYDFKNNEKRLTDLFTELIRIDEIGPTGVSKILHVINPDLFVMWDTKIAEVISTKHKHSTKGYLDFLKEMQKSAISVEKTFNRRGNPETYLNEKFELNPRCTIAKFLDEYNWGKYRKEWNFPPEWNVKILLEV